MKIKLLLLLIVFVISNKGFGQVKDKDTVIYKTSLRESKKLYQYGKDYFDNLSQGAGVSIMIPENKSPTYLVNGALIFNILDEKEYDHGYNAYEVFFQWNRNTLIDEEQNNISIGGVLDFNRIRDEKKGKIFIPVTFIGNYYKDFSNNQETLQFSTTMKFIQLTVKNIDISSGKFETYQVRKNGIFRYDSQTKVNSKKTFTKFSWVPYLGLEYDYTFSADEKDLKGNFLRGLLNLVGSLQFGKEGMFGVHANYQYRYSLFDTTELYDKSMHYLDAGVTCNLGSFKNFKPAIGLKYVNGQDPTQGFLDQSYLALNFTLKR